MKVTNKEYLEGMKEAREKWISDYNLDYNQMVTDENIDKARIATALEIIAEEMVGTREELSVIANNLMAIRNLQ